MFLKQEKKSIQSFLQIISFFEYFHSKDEIVIKAKYRPQIIMTVSDNNLEHKGNIINQMIIVGKCRTQIKYYIRSCLGLSQS